MIPRLVPLLAVLLCVSQHASSANNDKVKAGKASAPADDMDAYLHGMDSKPSFSVLVPKESIRQSQQVQLNEDDEVEARAVTEAYQHHIPFGTRLRPPSSPRPFTPKYATEAPGSKPLQRPLAAALPPPTTAPRRYVVPAPQLRAPEPKTTPIAARRFDTPEDDFNQKKRRKGKQGTNSAPHKDRFATGGRGKRLGFDEPLPPPPPPSHFPSTGFRDAPYEPLPPDTGPVSLKAPKRSRKTDFNEGINKNMDVGISPRQPHLPDQPNRYEPVGAARFPPPPAQHFPRDKSRKAKKKDGNFDEILDFIDKPENLKSSPKTPQGRKKGGNNSNKNFSPKADSKNAFKPIKGDFSKGDNKTQPNVNKRIAFLSDHPFQGLPQASFFFTNVGPNHIEYRGVFDPNSVPINFKDSPDALFQLIPQLPKLFDFDTRGIPPPQEPPKPRQTLPPRLPLPGQIDNGFPPPRPQPLFPQHPPPTTAFVNHQGPVPVDPPPAPVFPLALPPPPSLQAERPLASPFPKYDFVRGGLGDGAHYPKIFKFNEERISVLDFDRQKRAGQVIRRKGDDLDPERVPRNSFLIFHGGHFPSKEDNFHSGKSRFGGRPKNQFNKFVDSGNFLDEPAPPQEPVFFAPKAPPPSAPQPLFNPQSPVTSFQKTTKPGGYIYFIRTG